MSTGFVSFLNDVDVTSKPALECPYTFEKLWEVRNNSIYVFEVQGKGAFCRKCKKFDKDVEIDNHPKEISNVIAQQNVVDLYSRIAEDGLFYCNCTFTNVVASTKKEIYGLKKRICNDVNVEEKESQFGLILIFDFCYKIDEIKKTAFDRSSKGIDLIASEISNFELVTVGYLSECRTEVAQVFENPLNFSNIEVSLDVKYYYFSDNRLQSLFGNPKDFSWNIPLVWTHQTEEIFCELVVPPDSYKVRCQILAGPTGMGKSAICLLLALRLFGSRVPVLYISDAGNVWSKYNTSKNVLVYLITVYLKLNEDILTARIVAVLNKLVDNPRWDYFANVLNFTKSVVLIDEHGHAYNKINEARLDPMTYFPILIPNFYIDYMNIRTLFAGSNQGRFEIELSDTYSYCKIFIVPFTRAEACCFINIFSPNTSFPINSIFFLSNFVPREMKILFECKSSEDYIQKRVDSMSLLLEKTPKEAITYLQDFFRRSSMIMGSTNISFLDIGLIYRSQKVPFDSIVAFPLCYPAQIALIKLWRKFDQTSKQKWFELKANYSGSELGIHLENLVWDLLIYRGFNEVNQSSIDCCSIGMKIQTTHKYTFNACFSFASRLGKTDYKAISLEINYLRRYLHGNRRVLYRFPAGFKTCDFAIFDDNSFVVIQVSISSLTTHGFPDLNDLVGIKVTKYLYFTSTPESHPNIKWVNMKIMFVVDVDNWFNIE